MYIQTTAAGMHDLNRLSPQATANTHDCPRGCPTCKILLSVLSQPEATDGGTTGHPSQTGDGLVAPVSIRPSSLGQASAIVYACSCAVACSQHMRNWWRIQKSAQFMFGRCLKIWSVSRLAPRENEFATSLHDWRSPPGMKMWYNSGCAAGPEVAFDTSAPSLSTSRTRSPCRHRQLSPLRKKVSL